MRRRLAHPVVELVVAASAMVGGAWLVGVWLVGLVLIVIGVALAADAVLRPFDQPDRRELSPHEDLLERYRRSR